MCIGASNRLRDCANYQQVSWRNDGKEVWIIDNELLLIDAVEAMRQQGQAFSVAVIKNPRATANHGFGLLRVSSSWRPREGQAWSKIDFVTNVRLCLSAQPE